MERHDDNALIIYTDGSCLNTPRRGGCAYRFVWADATGNECIEDVSGPGLLGATISYMELLACIEALKEITAGKGPVPRWEYEKVVIYSDSQYVVDNLDNAKWSWPRNAWMTREGEPVHHVDLWKELVRLIRRIGRVEVRKVKAHKLNPHNKAVDRLAKASARAASRPMPGAPMVARRTSPRRTQPRSVPIDGQVETIRVLVVRDMPKQRYHQYKYEVVDEESASHHAVDDAYAEDGVVELRRNHTYEVRFSAGTRGRWIEEVIGEV